MLLKYFRKKLDRGATNSGPHQGLSLTLKDVPVTSPFYWLQTRLIERQVRTSGVSEIVEAPVEVAERSEEQYGTTIKLGPLEP